MMLMVHMVSVTHMAEVFFVCLVVVLRPSNIYSHITTGTYNI